MTRLQPPQTGVEEPATPGGTMLVMSPPSEAISRTVLPLTNEFSSRVIRLIVSISGAKRWLARAERNSNSKSEKYPQSANDNLCVDFPSEVDQQAGEGHDGDITRDLGTASRIMPTRSSMENNTDFVGRL
jgi:hypothetical protein